jgi:organic hydroperoxide reductase OsmC/OhrA
MKPKFPHRYVVNVDRIGPAVASIEAPPRPSLVGGPPPEFHGDPHVWSPEHLLAAALGLCLFTTFDVFAAREKLEVLGYRDIVTAVLDRTSAGLAFESFKICVELTVAPADLERARAVLERAGQFCIVSKALQAPVTIEPHIWSHENREHTSCAS